MDHVHTRGCYLQDATGGLVYTPCRDDGRDANLRVLKDADFRMGFGLKGLTLVCQHKDEPLTQLAEAELPQAPQDTRQQVHAISYTQHSGKDPWVGAYDSRITRDGSATAQGRVLTDDGDYFAIRFPGRGIHVYQRVPKVTMRSNPWYDAGILVLVIP